MSKKRKLRPFYRRLTRWIGLSQFIVMALASFLIYRIAEEVIKEEEFDLYEKSLKVTKKDVRRVLSDVYVGTTNHVPEIEENLNHPDKLFDIMQRVVELNPHIRSCGLCFIADYYPQNIRRRDTGFVRMRLEVKTATLCENLLEVSTTTI